jgi:hypothetical protein
VTVIDIPAVGDPTAVAAETPEGVHIIPAEAVGEPTAVAAETPVID